MAKNKPNPSPPPTAAAAAFDVPALEPAASNAAAVSTAETPADDVREASESEQPSNTPPVSPETPAPARQGDEGRPYCPVHQCLMRANGTREQVTTYTCPVPTCTCSEKRARPSVRIHREPTKCPNRICASPQQYLEFDPRRSNVAQLHMECPKCKFSLKQPRPQFAPQLEQEKRRRERDAQREDLADR